MRCFYCYLSDETGTASDFDSNLMTQWEETNDPALAQSIVMESCTAIKANECAGWEYIYWSADYPTWATCQDKLDLCNHSFGTPF